MTKCVILTFIKSVKMHNLLIFKAFNFSTSFKNFSTFLKLVTFCMSVSYDVNFS